MRSATLRAVLLMALTIAIAAPVSAGEVVRVKITDLAFTPAEITARIGDTVEWVNADFIDHTATANSDAWDVMVAAGKTERLQLTAAGTFDYFCRFHPNMTAKIHVTAN
jgi:plastocyanin